MFEYVPIMFDDVINSKNGELNVHMDLEDSKAAVQTNILMGAIFPVTLIYGNWIYTEKPYQRATKSSSFDMCATCALNMAEYVVRNMAKLYVSTHHYNSQKNNYFNTFEIQNGLKMIFKLKKITDS